MHFTYGIINETLFHLQSTHAISRVRQVVNRNVLRKEMKRFVNVVQVSYSIKMERNATKVSNP